MQIRRVMANGAEEHLIFRFAATKEEATEGTEDTEKDMQSSETGEPLPAALIACLWDLWALCGFRAVTAPT